jgi:hypothetical protein
VWLALDLTPLRWQIELVAYWVNRVLNGPITRQESLVAADDWLMRFSGRWWV